MLRLEPRIERPDDFYETLIGVHQGLDAEQSALLNAKLILLLANQVGDMDVLAAALAKARDGLVPTEGDDTLQAVA